MRIKTVSCLVGVAALASCKTAGPADSGSALQNAAPPPAGNIEFDSELGEQPWPGEEDATKQIAALITEQISKTYPANNRPARRDAHPKAHGCVRATFKVNDQLPNELAHGAFQRGKSYKAWIRFSNGDSDANRADGEGDARGMAIKLMGVPGPKLIGDEQNTQDFIMINHPVFFMDDPMAYVTLIKKVGSSNPLVKLSAPLSLGLKGGLIARDILAKKIANPLDTRFWSMVPYRLGDDQSKQAIKFSARPCQTRENEPTKEDTQHPSFLRKAMQERLNAEEGCFEFLVQPRTTPSMSVENSMVEWKEGEAPFIKVATITIPKQVFDKPAQHTFCENLSFSPWHATAEHRPLGGVNRVRRVVYDTISAHRHGMNGAPRQEPTGDETF